jgi:hypothetical protein
MGKSVNGLAVWATGFVASDPDLNYNQLPVMLIDCRTRPGQSGSPVIAFRRGNFNAGQGVMGITAGPIQKFIGIYSGRIHKDSDIGMVWKVSAIQELINSFAPPVFNPTRPMFGSTGFGFLGGPLRGYRPRGA